MGVRRLSLWTGEVKWPEAAVAVHTDPGLFEKDLVKVLSCTVVKDNRGQAIA